MHSYNYWNVPPVAYFLDALLGVGIVSFRLQPSSVALKKRSSGYRNAEACFSTKPKLLRIVAQKHRQDLCGSLGIVS